jgi:hypothetical protein
VAGPELLQAEHPHAAAGELIERRAAGGAEPADDNIEMGHIASLHYAAAVVEAPRVKLVYVMVLLVGTADLAAAQGVPLPRPRPASAAAPTEEAGVAEAPTACRLRLTAALASAPSLPPITGPGECGAPDVVRLEAVVLPDLSRVAIVPPAVLRCTMAEAIVSWVREEAAPRALDLGSPLQSIANLASFDCRGRNRIVGAKLSEHGKGNALDIRALKLADGQVVELTDPQVPKDFRDGLRQSVCAHFMTVLGPGSDGYHEDHVHVDLAERRNNYRLCEWDVREPAAVAVDIVPLPRARPPEAR